jgi:diacylglycerol O-acyltransferase
MSKNLNPLDASWLLVESRDTPMHVGGLLRFSLPDDLPADFFRQLITEFRAARSFAPPWNQKLRSSLIDVRKMWPAWERTEDLDLEHHVRLSALPTPGGERELGQLIARLHSQPLDLSRPPWECEVIEGLAGGRQFAIYVKMHHSLIDGIGGIKLLERAMAGDAEASLKLLPFWSIGSGQRSSGKRPPTPAEVIAGLTDAVRGQVSSAADIARAFGSMFAGLGSRDRLAIPYEAPMSILNGRIHGQRRFATQRFPLERLKGVASAVNCTLNDVVLALCGGALRRFLLELDELPDTPLTAGIPVSVRPKDDEGTGNAITFIISTLGTDVATPLERLRAISASTRRAKEHVASLPRRAMMQYTLVLMAPYMASLVTGVGGRTRPMFNITISNVPGPDRPLYFRGARLEAAYPVSLITHGQALNITCQSYDGHLAFGFTGCRDTLPHMQRIATYTGEALDELEAALGLGGKRRPSRRRATPKPIVEIAADAVAPGEPPADAVEASTPAAPPTPSASPAKRKPRAKSSAEAGPAPADAGPAASSKRRARAKPADSAAAPSPRRR